MAPRTIGDTRGQKEVGPSQLDFPCLFEDLGKKHYPLAI